MSKSAKLSRRRLRRAKMKTPKPVILKSRQKSAVYPTQLAILIMAICAPVALILALLAPQMAGLGIIFVAAIIGLLAVDALLAAPMKSIAPDILWPGTLYIDDEIDVQIDVNLPKRRRPRNIQIRIETDEKLELDPNYLKLVPYPGAPVVSDTFKTTTRRRGIANIQSLWTRWSGPLGMVYKQTVVYNAAQIPVMPNIKSVSEKAMAFFDRNARLGQKLQDTRGESTEFDSLREFVVGMDRRSIDWKHSARHRDLVAKEYQTERNHNIIFAVDSGRLMCDPIEGIPKIDRALNSALLLSYIALKTGDRVGLYAFDAKPRAFLKPVSGLPAFAHIQKQASEIEYAITETNFTFGLTRLKQQLSRRSLIIIFTDFVDTTTAELMLENVSRLTKTHLVLFVTFKDLALESYMNREIEDVNDVTRAVIANTLNNERTIVLGRLRRMGVQILECNPDNLASDLLNKFLALKLKGRL